jgi:hypothetical protein
MKSMKNHFRPWSRTLFPLTFPFRSLPLKTARFVFIFTTLLALMNITCSKLGVVDVRTSCQNLEMLRNAFEYLSFENEWHRISNCNTKPENHCIWTGNLVETVFEDHGRKWFFILHFWRTVMTLVLKITEKLEVSWQITARRSLDVPSYPKTCRRLLHGCSKCCNGVCRLQVSLKNSSTRLEYLVRGLCYSTHIIASHCELSSLSKNANNSPSCLCSHSSTCRQ